MSSKTTAQAISAMRNLMSIPGREQYYDGTTGDVAPSSTSIPILSFLNAANRMLQMAGFATHDTDFITIASTFEYALPETMGKIITVYLGDGTELRNKTLDDLRRSVPGFRGITGKPTIFIDLPQQICFWPVPDDDYGPTVKAGRCPVDLAAPNSAIPDLPDRHFDTLVFLGCVLWCISDAESDGNEARKATLLSLVGQMAPELKDVLDARAALEQLARPGG